MAIFTKRIYEPPDPTDGRRYLIDRLWPRGCRKEDAQLAGWLKDLAPSTELRRWYGHDLRKYPEFRARYRRELADHACDVERLCEEARRSNITLVYASEDPDHSNATVLHEYLQEWLRSGSLRGAALVKGEREARQR